MVRRNVCIEMVCRVCPRDFAAAVLVWEWLVSPQAQARSDVALIFFVVHKCERKYISMRDASEKGNLVSWPQVHPGPSIDEARRISTKIE